MESKIVDTLVEMGEVLSNYYTPSASKLYALRKLEIDIPKVHHRDRKKKLTDAWLGC